MCGFETGLIFENEYISTALRDTDIVQKETDPFHCFVLLLKHGNNNLEGSKIIIKLEIYYCFV